MHIYPILVTSLLFATMSNEGVSSTSRVAQKTAYRRASITVAIIVVIPRSARAQTIALRRFVEVSVGIIVALVAVALWPEHQASAVKSAG